MLRNSSKLVLKPKWKFFQLHQKLLEIKVRQNLFMTNHKTQIIQKFVPQLRLKPTAELIITNLISNKSLRSISMRCDTRTRRKGQRRASRHDKRDYHRLILKSVKLIATERPWWMGCVRVSLLRPLLSSAAMPNCKNTAKDEMQRSEKKTY